MLNKRVLILCIILAVLAAALQAVPSILGCISVFAAILGGLPVYIAARLHWALGISVYLSTAYISSNLEVSRALFFICTCGIVGIFLGITKDRFRSIYLPPVPTALVAVGMLLIVNYYLRISIFSYSSLKTPGLQALVLFPPTYIYCLIYLKLAVFADTLVHKHFQLDTH
jgi:hypothetical protein